MKRRRLTRGELLLAIFLLLILLGRNFGLLKESTAGGRAVATDVRLVGSS
jgi:hypothetical protein